MDNFYRIPPDLRDLNYEKFVESGEVKISSATDFNSKNTKQLNLDEMKGMLMTIPYMQAALKGIDIEPEE